MHWKCAEPEPWGQERDEQGDLLPAPLWKLLPSPALIKGSVQYNVPPLIMQSWVLRMTVHGSDAMPMVCNLGSAQPTVKIFTVISVTFPCLTFLRSSE